METSFKVEYLHSNSTNTVNGLTESQNTNANHFILSWRTNCLLK